MKFSPEKYPILVQVIDTYLMAYSPDFDYKIAEKYEPQSLGQTELLIIRMREHLSRLAKKRELDGKDIPNPTLPSELMSGLKSEYLSSRDAARLLRISHDTLTRMAKRKEIHFKITPGGHRRYLRIEVERLLKE